MRRGSLPRTGQLIEFEAEGDGEEKQLICDSDEQCDDKIIVI